jgi:hypothetical protein
MNHRAGGTPNGRTSHSNRRSESSDLNDMKVLAAAAARPAPAPTLQERGPELSGMIGGGRHSVVGARIDDRAPLSALSALSAAVSWTWLAAGCAAVLLPGLIGVWILARSSPAAAERTSVAVVAPAPALGAVAEPPAPPVQIEPIARLPAMVPDSEPAAPAVRGPVRYYRHRRYRGASPAALAAMAAASSSGAGSAAAPAAAPSANAADQAPADSPEAADNKAAASAESSAEKPKKAVEAAPEEAASAAPKTLKELRSALARLQNRVVACHQRFQVDGVADVRVAVNPSGTVESASLAGEFEGTPTGDCIVRLVSAASFPSFDGTESVKVSHSFSLE